VQHAAKATNVHEISVEGWRDVSKKIPNHIELFVRGAASFVYLVDYCNSSRIHADSSPVSGAIAMSNGE
jgi:hypothetical protein